MTAHLQNPKLHSLAEAQLLREDLRQRGQSFVLTNGCFDLLHPGHLYYLREAAKLGHSLWVALNGDESIRALKGPTRPLQSQDERAYMLGGLECVQGIVFFNSLRLDQEILALQPDVYVKAGDYTLETLNTQERQALEAVQTKIYFAPFLKGYSTTAMVEHIRTLPL